MTTTAQPRVLPGVPSGGEFTAVGHSDQVAALRYPLSAHEQAFIGLMSDTLDHHGESTAARGAVLYSLISGDFGSDTGGVSALLEDDRYVRLAVDRFVVNESDAPGTHPADQTGQMLGRYLIDLRNEDESDAEDALEESE